MPTWRDRSVVLPPELFQSIYFPTPVNLPDYNYWNVGVSYTYKNLTADLRYHDTDLSKTECFCFTQQNFTAGEGRDMGVQFMIDPALPEFIDRVTLSYTFFVNRPETAELASSEATTGSTT